MAIDNLLKTFLLTKAKTSNALKTNSATFQNNLTPTLRPLLQKLYLDLHALLAADGSLPKIKEGEK
jgi:hypothetical protein